MKSIKEFCKTFNNFNFTAKLLALGGLVGIVSAVSFLLLYQLGTGETHALAEKQFLGMFYFIAAILSIIVGVTLVYKAMPYVSPKQKLVPATSFVWLLLAQNILLLFMLVVAFIILGTETVKIPALYVVNCALAGLSICYSILWIYPNIICQYYCVDPNVNHK